MCEKCGCTNPEKKEENPEKCTEEQVAECHPVAEGHPCEEKKEE